MFMEFKPITYLGYSKTNCENNSKQTFTLYHFPNHISRKSDYETQRNYRLFTVILLSFSANLS